MDKSAPRSIDLPVINTKGLNETVNGWIVSLWKDWEGTLKYPPKQAYVNCCLSGETKGPHLHKVRSGAFVTITGKLLFVARYENRYYEFPVEPQNGQGMKLIEIPPGVPCCIYNIGTTDAIFLNMPSPAWHPDLPDDWPVENWTYKLSLSLVK